MGERLGINLNPILDPAHGYQTIEVMIAVRAVDFTALVGKLLKLIREHVAESFGLKRAGFIHRCTSRHQVEHAESNSANRLFLAVPKRYQAKMDAERCLKRMAQKLPGAIGVRFTSTLEHIDRARTLFPIDREMASFRAITGEEEAATALMMAIQSKRYQGADQFKAWNHQHKAAVIACVMAVSRTLQPLLKEYQLIFDFEKCRIDVKVPPFELRSRGRLWIAVC